MDRTIENTNNSPKELHQRQKVYIEDLEIDESIETFERDLKKFLSKYGNVLDIKILKNSNITRRGPELRVCYF